MRKMGFGRNVRRATMIGAAAMASVAVMAGPAAADCDLGEVGRSGTAASGSSVLVGGLVYVCIGDVWVG